MPFSVLYCIRRIKGVIDIISSSGYNNNIMYSTREAAEILGLSQDHVKLLARKGLIEAKKIGRDWVVINLDYKRKRKPKRK